MKKQLTLGQRIKALRESRNQNQKQFAVSLGVTQGGLSGWERDDPDRRPSADMLFRIWSLSKDPIDTIWFWEKAGLTQDAILSAANKILEKRLRPPAEGELVYVPALHENPEAKHKGGLWLPAQNIPNPGLARFVVIDEQSAGDVFKTGDVIVMERNVGSPFHFEPFCGQMVVVQLGMFSIWKGEMIHEESASNPIAVALVRFGPSDESRLSWGWRFLTISAEPGAPGLDGYYQSFEHRHVNDEHRKREQERLKDPDLRKSIQEEIEAKARTEGHTHHSRILGRFVAWFRPPEAREQK